LAIDSCFEKRVVCIGCGIMETMRRLQIATVFFAMVLAACPGPEESVEQSCSLTSQCEPGQICQDGQCVEVDSSAPADAGTVNDSGAATDGGIPFDAGVSTPDANNPWGADSGFSNAGDGGLAASDSGMTGVTDGAADAGPDGGADAGNLTGLDAGGNPDANILLDASTQSRDAMFPFGDAGNLTLDASAADGDSGMAPPDAGPPPPDAGPPPPDAGPPPPDAGPLPPDTGPPPPDAGPPPPDAGPPPPDAGPPGMDSGPSGVTVIGDYLASTIRQVVAGNDRLFLFFLQINDEMELNPHNVKWGGVNLTEAPGFGRNTVFNGLGGSPENSIIEVWYLLEADFPPPGSHDITWDGATGPSILFGNSLILANVNQSAPFGDYEILSSDSSTKFETVDLNPGVDDHAIGLFIQDEDEVMTTGNGFVIQMDYHAGGHGMAIVDRAGAATPSKVKIEISNAAMGALTGFVVQAQP
jgi:hypothetical protein